MLIAIRLLAIAGFTLSLYAFLVEHRAKQQPEKKALCDVCDSISCTKAFSSQYGHLFSIPNSLLGLAYYAFLFILSFTRYSPYLFYLTLPSIAMTLYLIYITYIKLKNYCLVCHGIYVVNIALLVLTFLNR